MNTLHKSKKNKSNLGLTHDVHATALIASLLYMMTCYSNKKDSSLVQPIIESLEWLSGHPEVVNSQLEEILSKLKINWQQISEVDNSELSTALH